MKGEVQFRADKLAVLIDADNARANLIEPLLKEVAKYGTANVKRIYGDWTTPHLGSWKNKLNEFAIVPIQQFRYTVGKNSTDSALIIDAMDLLYTKTFDGFCIISSDSDYTRLASRIREAGLTVYGFGEKKTPQPFVVACDKFIYTEILELPEKSEKENLNQRTSIEETHVKNLVEVNSSLINEELTKLLKDAYESSAGEDGWANIGAFGSQINRLSSAFEPRAYGYKKLTSLIKATEKFDVKETPHLTNPNVKEFYIKLSEAKN